MGGQTGGSNKGIEWTEKEILLREKYAAAREANSQLEEKEKEKDGVLRIHLANAKRTETTGSPQRRSSKRQREEAKAAGSAGATSGELSKEELAAIFRAAMDKAAAEEPSQFKRRERSLATAVPLSDVASMHENEGLDSSALTRSDMTLATQSEPATAPAGKGVLSYDDI